MNRKNIAIVAATGGLLAAAFFAGNVLMKDGARPMRVDAGGITPVVTPTSTPGISVTAEPDGGSLVIEDSNASSQSSGNGNGGGSQPQGNGNDSQQPQVGSQQQPQDNGGQPEAEPAPQDPQPEDPQQPQPEPQPVNDAPAVVKVVPTDDAKGIGKASNIVIHFSEPMDKASAQAAFKMTSPLTAGVFSWDLTETIMTFNPNADFDYGAQVQYLVLDSAKDKSGKPMTAGFDGTFKVIRRSTTVLISQAGADGTVYAPPVMVNGPKAIWEGLTFDVGTWQRGFVSFNLASLPADIVSIEAAEFAIYQTNHDLNAYVTTGNLVMKSVTYGALDAGDWGKAANQFCLGPCVDMQVTLSNNALNGWKGADLLGMVNLDWANREARNFQSQFRLQFMTENNGNGPEVSATFATGQGNARPTLEVTYLHP